eukprot:scpid64007/ scgid29545/ 
MSQVSVPVVPEEVSAASEPCAPGPSQPCAPVAVASQDSATTGRKTKGQSSKKSPCENFVWGEDEVRLLLSSVLDYKTSKAADGVDWDSVKSKYVDILDKYIMESTPSPGECSAAAQ